MSDRTKVGLLIVLVKLWLLLAELTGGVYAQGWFQDPNCPDGNCPLIQQPQQPIINWAPRQRQQPQQPQQDSDVRYERAPASVVRVWNGGSRGSGSVIETGPVSLVLTAAHVFSEGTSSKLSISCAGQDYPARLIGADRESDLALLEVDAELPCEIVTVADRAPDRGEEIFASGYGGEGGDNRYSVLHAQAIGYIGFTKQGPVDVLKVTGCVRQGDSGGPMLDSSGRLVAVVQVKDGSTTAGTCCVGIRRFLSRFRDRFRGRRKPQQGSRPMPGPSTDEWRAPEADPDQPPLVPVPPRDDAQLAELQQQLADTQAALEAARNAHECGDDCNCKAGELAKLQAELQAANSKPPKIVEVEKPVEVPGKPKIVTRVKEKIVHVAGNWLGTLATGALVGVGVSTPLAGLAVWLGRRRLKKRLKQWEGGDLSSAAVTPSSELQRERDGLLARLRSEREEVVRLRAELATKPAERIIREPAAPTGIAIEERHHNLYTHVPVSKEAAAYARAHQIYGNKFPGVADTLRAVTKLKEQILAGEPTEAE